MHESTHSRKGETSIHAGTRTGQLGNGRTYSLDRLEAGRVWDIRHRVAFDAAEKATIALNGKEVFSTRCLEHLEI